MVKFMYGFFVFLLVAIITCACVGCSLFVKEKEVEKKEEQSRYKIVVIDNCEYIECTIGGYASGSLLVHKANCHNPEHKR